MPLETLFISGPPGGGKSTVATLVAADVLKRPIHLIRMKAAPDSHTNTIMPEDSVGQEWCGHQWASYHEVQYTPERVFETLPDALRAVRKIERRGFTIVEADTDQSLRHAYPYDYRIFVMRPPCDVYDVLRDPKEAARALHTVMQDTATFASEVFGLFDMAGMDDSVGVKHEHPMPAHRSGTAVEKLEITEAQIRHFINSPIGAEIVSRIQLQPDYHALVESDVVVINTGLCGPNETLQECIQRIEKLLARIRHDARRRSLLYWGDVNDRRDKACAKLIKRLDRLFSM